jgi:carboxypeptidase D
VAPALAALEPGELAALGFEPDHGSGGGADWAYGWANEGALDELPRTVREALRAERAPEPEITAELRAGYHDYTALTAELQSLAADYPALVRLETAGKSIQGRELWYVVLSDDAATDDRAEPKFLYHANMHGDEVVGRELMLMLARDLASGYGKDARATRLLDHAQIFIMPSMNPDGFELGRRGNARNVDVNRNFPDRFTSTSDTPEGREVEVQRMMALAAANHFVYGINWHGGEICFNLPWGNIRNTTANRYWDDAAFAPVGRAYTAANQKMYANHEANFDHGLTYGYEWYPVNGGINDFFNWYRRSVHAVVELSVVKWPPSRELAGFWQDNREAMLAYLDRGLLGVHLEVKSAVDGALVDQPTVRLASAPGRTLTFNDAWIHRFAAPGEQTVTVEASGFKPATVTVPATVFDGSFTRVVLEPAL